MRGKKIWIGPVLLAALITGACAEPPAEEVDAAQASLSEAETAGGETYAPEEMRAAREAMDAVQAEMNTQQEKFALFRSYKQTSQLVTDAKTKAEEAVAAAAAGRQRMMEEAQAAVDTARQTLDRATALVGELEGCRRKPKGFAADLAALKASLDALSAELANAEGSLASEDYAQAKSQAESVNSQGETLVADLEAAKTKIGC